MSIKYVWAVYFSPTGTTQKIVTNIASVISKKLGVTMEKFDFTLPKERERHRIFSKDDCVILGVPVIAGRVPNVLLKFLDTMEGGQALAVPIVVYGNRNYDDALIELKDILENDSFRTIAAGAFIGEHSFSRVLAKDRPDHNDMQIAADFANQIAEKVIAINEPVTPHVKGIPYPYRGYFKPRDRKGNIIDIRKVKPLTRDNCNGCMLCAKKCPMGSISFENPKELTGICIKCGACIKICPQQAKYYVDPGYLYHLKELEEVFVRRAEPELFL